MMWLGFADRLESLITLRPTTQLDRDPYATTVIDKQLCACSVRLRAPAARVKDDVTAIRVQAPRFRSELRECEHALTSAGPEVLFTPR